MKINKTLSYHLSLLRPFLLLWGGLLLFLPTIQAQKRKANALLCDTIAGVCAPANANAKQKPGKASLQKTQANPKPIRITYFTDPICSTCWGIEPQLRKLKMDYGHLIQIDYKMGGLLPKWEGFNGGGITKPSDVAHHWDEVSRYYQMPIDGDGWLSDPLPSSYPPSIAFKAAEFQNHDKAHLFLRAMKEAVFMEKQNIARWSVQARLAASCMLDTNLLKKDMKGRGQQAFQADLALAKSMGVRGFPTLFVENTANASRVMVYGYKPYDDFANALRAVLGEAPEAKAAETNLESLFQLHPSLTAKEYAVLAGLPLATAEQQLSQWAAQGRATVVATKNGNLWRRLN